MDADVKPLVFLDVDGVLNSDRWYRTNPTPEEDPGPDAFYRSMIDPAAVKLLKWLLDRSRADVVLSSSWRKIMTPEDLAVILRDKGLGPDWLGFVGETPRGVRGLNHGSSRGQEIHEWLLLNPKTATRYVILDDDWDMAPVRANHVHTDHKVGLTKADVEKALEMLG